MEAWQPTLNRLYRYCVFSLLITLPLKAADPFLHTLQEIAQERNSSRTPTAPTVATSAPTQQSTLSSLADYRFDERMLRIFPVFTAKHLIPLRQRSVDTKPARYLGISEYRPTASPRPDPRLVLGLKEIIEPLPQDYAQAYLKLKTLLNPTQKYLRVHIDKSRQRMWVYLDNDYLGDWKVSTARRGYWTPNGVYRPHTLERMHYSKKYHHSPMPWSVFFKGGYAIHGTYSIRHLGRPASHGCVRIHPRNAKKLYQLIRRYGKQNTQIIIRG